MAKILGIDLTKTIAKTLGPLVAPCVLVKVAATTPTSGQLTGGDNPTSTSYPCRGFFDSMPTRFPQNRTQRQKTEIKKADQIITILGGTLPGSVEPVPGDSIIMKGRTYRVVAVGNDAAYSVGQSAAYACLVRGA